MGMSFPESKGRMLRRVVTFLMLLFAVSLMGCTGEQTGSSLTSDLQSSGTQSSGTQSSGAQSSGAQTSGTHQASEPVSETRLMLDTVCTITIHEPNDKSLLAAAFDICADYEALLSTTVEGSDIWRINHAGGAPVTVSEQTARVISVGLDYGKLSDGMFDITIGRLSTLWDFKNRSTVPPETDIAIARETVDYMQVTVDGDTVRSANPDASIDLGGIAKGYITDRLADFLKENGVKSAVIDLGGNVVVVGKKTGGAPWTVGVRYPFGSQGELLGVLETGEASIVTSGIYERQFEENGIIYHHILDPNTGMPVRSDIVSVTVISESSMIGDVTTTVALLVGSEKMKDLIDKIPGFIGALLVLENGELIQLGNINFHEID